MTEDEELAAAVEESGWDAEFLRAAGEIARSGGLDADDPRWELMMQFAVEADMQFAWVLYTRLRERVSDFVLELLCGEEDVVERGDPLEQVEAMAHDLYLPAQAGRELLRELLLLGIRVAWDIPEQEDG